MDSAHLLKTRRFLPYFITQFGGAFNDSLIRRSVEMMIVYQGMSGALAPEMAVFLLLAFFMAPFFVFSAFAGYLADSGSKEKMVQIIKAAELGIVALASYGLFHQSFIVSAVAIICLGTHSTFFGPIKFSLPPQHVTKDELIAANGLIEAGTNAAILLGTMIGSSLVTAPGGVTIVSLIAMGAAALGVMSSFQIPAAPPIESRTITRRSTRELLRRIYRHKEIWRVTLGISWFWTLGAILISLFSLVVKDLLGAPESCVTALFAVFSIGVAVGSICCNRLLKGEVEATWVPLAALVMAASLFLFYLFVPSQPHAATTTAALLLSFRGIGIIISLLILSIAAGIYIVPLYGLLQSRTSAHERSQIVAANNVLNAAFMVAGSVLFAIIFKIGISVSFALLILSAVNVLAAMYACFLLPGSLFRSLLQLLFRSFFRARVEGLQHLITVGPKALIIANHLSFLDAVMLGAFLPEKVTFAVNTEISREWWMRPAIWCLDVIPIDPANPMAIRVLIDKVKQNGKVVIFPEGRITVTGALMKVYEGPAMIADKADAPLVPIRLEGFQYTIFSKVTGLFRRKLFPQLSLTVCEPTRLKVPPESRGRKRREALGIALHDLMTDLMYKTTPRGPTLLHAIYKRASIAGSSKVIARDALGGSVTIGGLLKRSFVISEAVTPIATGSSSVGLLLPNGLPMLLFFFAFHWKRRVPALLNYSHSIEQMVATCTVASIKTVMTSRKFITLGKLDQHVARLSSEGIEFLYLEDIAAQIGVLTKIRGGLTYYWRKVGAGLGLTDFIPGESSDSAAILFTSGSEGTPKGVVLSHSNLLNNIDQVTSAVPLVPTDKVFNALPMFHSFGLTGGTLMPIVKGVSVMLYPSPLHYRIIPEMVYNESATILFGTPTFLAGYARKAHPYDFFTVRYVFSGAEKLSDSVRGLYQERFGIRIFEGYGATETAPVIAVNTPFYAKRGTVGRFVPGIDYRIDAIPGIPEGGRLFVRGPNVMKGYYKIDRPGVLQPLDDEWYDTGDIISVDEEGFIMIQGRAKRFAKIGGEMISLTAVEQALYGEWPKYHHCVVSVPDAKKGERLVLVTTNPKAQRENVLEALRNRGLPEIAMPREVRTQASIPLLGSGKVDVQGVIKSLAE